jgi:hypothetical protein
LFSKVVKWVSITALVLGLFLSTSSGYRIALEIIVCVAGLVVVMEAVRTGKFFWGIGFVTLATLFNPVVPVPISQKAFLWLDVVCLMAFLSSLGSRQSQPIPSTPSITGRTTGSVSS